MRSQRGIALIQVLLIAGIIGMLMLQLGLTAREQVARAKRLDDRATLELAAQSRESAILYSLMTEPWVQKPGSQNPYAAAWNFQGEPFEVDGVVVSIQDESGKWRVPLYGVTEFGQILAGLGVDAGRARRLGAQLMQLQGVSSGLASLGEEVGIEALPVGKGYPLQDLEELKLLPDMDEDLYKRLSPLLTLFPTPGFNPLTAAPDLLRAQLSDSQLAGLQEASRAGRLDQLALAKLTGIQTDEMTILAPGPGLFVRFSMERGMSRVDRGTIFIVRPYQSEPLAVWQRSGNEEDSI